MNRSAFDLILAAGELGISPDEFDVGDLEDLRVTVRTAEAQRGRVAPERPEPPRFPPAPRQIDVPTVTDNPYVRPPTDLRLYDVVENVSPPAPRQIDPAPAPRPPRRGPMLRKKDPIPFDIAPRLDPIPFEVAPGLPFEVLPNEPTINDGPGPNLKVAAADEPETVFTQLLAFASQELSGAVGLDPGRTVSSQAGQAMLRGESWAVALCAGLDAVDPGHCNRAFKADRGASGAISARSKGQCCPQRRR